MSRQISFFHSERDLQKFIEVVDCNGGLIVFNDELVPVSYTHLTLPTTERV